MIPNSFLIFLASQINTELTDMTNFVEGGHMQPQVQHHGLVRPYRVVSIFIMIKCQ